MSNRVNSRYQSSKIAFCGLMTALSVVLMLAGGIGGIFALVWVYMKIEKKYRVQNP